MGEKRYHNLRSWLTITARAGLFLSNAKIGKTPFSLSWDRHNGHRGAWETYEIHQFPPERGVAIDAHQQQLLVWCSGRWTICIVWKLENIITLQGQKKPRLPEADTRMIRRDVGPQSPGFPCVSASAVPSPGGGSIPAGPPPVPRSRLFITGLARLYVLIGQCRWEPASSPAALSEKRVARHQPLALIFPIMPRCTAARGRRGKTDSLCQLCVFECVVYMLRFSTHTPTNNPPFHPSVFLCCCVGFVRLIWLMAEQLRGNRVKKTVLLHSAVQHTFWGVFFFFPSSALPVPKRRAFTTEWHP